MKAKEFDKKFDAGEEITEMLDLSKAKRPFHDSEKKNIDNELLPDKNENNPATS